MLGSLSNKRVLVTGAGGFTGCHLVNVLRQNGSKVLELKSSSAKGNDQVSVDLLDKSKLFKVVSDFQPDVVFHLAAISFVGHSNPLDFYNVNVIGTENLLESLVNINNPLLKVLVASSANVYGQQNVDVISESNVCEPVNHYAISKLAMESITALYYSKLSIIITRPFNYTGLGQDGNFIIPKLVSHFARRASSIEMGNVDVERDFSSVQLITEAYIKLVTSSYKSGIVNVCSGRSVAIRELIDFLNNLAGYKMEIKVNPKFVRKNDIQRITGDNTKLKSIVGEVNCPDIFDEVKQMYFQGRDES